MSKNASTACRTSDSAADGTGTVGHCGTLASLATPIKHTVRATRMKVDGRQVEGRVRSSIWKFASSAESVGPLRRFQMETGTSGRVPVAGRSHSRAFSVKLERAWPSSGRPSRWCQARVLALQAHQIPNCRPPSRKTCAACCSISRTMSAARLTSCTRPTD